MRVPPLPQHERLLWEGHPSWADHAVLFLLMGAALLRAALAMRSGEWLTMVLYLLAIGVFFGMAALFRCAVFYQISSKRIRITSGFRAKQVREVPLDHIGSVAVRREILNRWFDLGTLDITPREALSQIEDSFTLKGVPDPDRLKQQIELCRGPLYQELT
jgi:membrane protein YdbS with pleckstrin-like domain